MNKPGGFFSLFDLPATRFDADALQRLAKAMDSGAILGVSSCDSGYVYLGQFITHDITKRGTLPAGKFVPASQLVQQRTPALDLDNVYGDGFDDAQIAVDKGSGKMLLGTVYDSSNKPGSDDDLPRERLKARARIGDERDDENLLVAQLHVQFLKLHNLFVDRIVEQMPGLKPWQYFDEARRNLILCYQDVILYDYLRAVLDEEVWQRVIRNKQVTLWPANRTASMPIEFAAAAFRFGHAMVRPSYAINRLTSANGDDLFRMTGQSAKAFDGRRGLPDTHIVDWRMFFSGLSGREEPPFSNRAAFIDPTVGLTVDLPQRPGASGPGNSQELIAALDLRAGNFSMLPDAQAIVAHLEGKYPALSLELLHEEQLNPKDLLHELRGDGGRHEYLGLTKQTPLFYYVLCEAHARKNGSGRWLGRLGSLIVAETLRALIDLSSPSVLHKRDKVLDDLGVEATGEEIDGRPHFKMIDLLKPIGPQGRTGVAPADDRQPPFRHVA